ncbi:8944_t:CDS:2, partial [Gigaspora rosea]
QPITPISPETATIITLTVIIPTITQSVTQTLNITITQIAQPTTVFQTTIATATVTPPYFQDQNVIIEDKVIALIAVFTFILAVYFEYKQRLNNKLKLAKKEQQKIYQLALAIDSTITPVTTA